MFFTILTAKITTSIYTYIKLRINNKVYHIIIFCALHNAPKEGFARVRWNNKCSFNSIDLYHSFPFNNI